ncbi:MAG TPA: hypothetical protein VKS22_12160 [Candidatus Binataceae bacterium]|nr:hypothetical protein [Candidatus Binataceae bacterium]
MEIEQARREGARWGILRILDAGRPMGVNDAVILRVLIDEKLITAARDLKRELDYLNGLDLIQIEHDRHGKTVAARLTAAGVEVVEYTAAAPAGIARPHRETH